VVHAIGNAVGCHMPPIYLVVVVPRYVRVWDCGEQGQGDVATGVVRLLGVE
jgi:hypothetical protein